MGATAPRGSSTKGEEGRCFISLKLREAPPNKTGIKIFKAKQILEDTHKGKKECAAGSAQTTLQKSLQAVVNSSNTHSASENVLVIFHRKMKN